MPTWFVEPLKSRPSYPLVVAFLWGEKHDIDSDGDSSDPRTTEWTWLYVASRERPEEVIDVNIVDDVPHRFTVKSDLPWLAAATAYILAFDRGARARAADSDRWLELQELRPHLAPFDLAAAWRRCQHSHWPR